jgi:ankyrin repeat protein
VNARGDDGWTPLYWAADGGHKNVVALLIAKGADVNFGLGLNMEEMGMTPLFKAARSGHEEIAELLIAEGVDGPRADLTTRRSRYGS